MAKLNKVWAFGTDFAHEELISEGKDAIGGEQFSGHTTNISGKDQMKVSGLSKEQWLDVATKVDSALQWKAMSETTGQSFEGYFSYKVHSSTPWKLQTASGQFIHKPCGHVIVAIVSGAMDFAKSHGLQPVIWAAKLKFMVNTPVSHYKTLQGKINGEYICVCKTKGKFPGVYDPAIDKAEGMVSMEQEAPAPVTPNMIYGKSFAPKAKPTYDELFIKQPTVEKVTSQKWALEYEPVKADQIMDGESDTIPTEKRTAEVAIAGLYVLAEIYSRTINSPAALRRGQWRDMNDLRKIEYMKRLDKFQRAYGARLARNFFDFLTIACFGEARYKDGGLYSLHAKGGKQQGRGTAYQTALSYDPRHLLPVMEQVFGRVNWGGGYGGPKWAFIAKQAQWYFKLHMAPVAFADHVVDLSHNGGLAFNKGYIVSNPKDQASYMEMLNFKRNDPSGLTQWDKKFDVPEEVYRYMVEAVSLGFLPSPKANIWPIKEATVPTLKWGSDKLKAVFLTAPGSMQSYMEKMEQEEEKKSNPKGFKPSAVAGSGIAKAKLLEAR